MSVNRNVTVPDGASGTVEDASCIQPATRPVRASTPPYRDIRTLPSRGRMCLAESVESGGHS